MGPLLSAAEVFANAADFLLVDARPGRDAYASGHLRGALHLSLDDDLSAARFAGHDPTQGGRHPLPPCEWFRNRIAQLGISGNARVVLYDDAGGANAAARAYWMFRALGHSAAFVLDGGLPAALAAGMDTTWDVPTLAAAGSSTGPLEWTLPLVSLEEVERRAQDPDWRILDVRSAPRFRGEVEPLDPVAGHIPGAKNLFFGENLDPDGRFKPAAALRTMYESFLGDVPAEQLIVHCGSGVTACHTLLALDIAGLSGASLYVGSWSEWCRSGKPLGKGAAL